MSEGQKFSKEYTQKKNWIEKEQKMTVWVVKKNQQLHTLWKLPLNGKNAF